MVTKPAASTSVTFASGLHWVRPWVVLGIVTGMVALAGCTTATTTTPVPVVTVKTVQPTQQVSVDDADSPGDRAIQMSEDLFTSAPIVLVAPAGDQAAQRTAAATAQKWGVPLLLNSSAASPSPEPTASVDPAPTPSGSDAGLQAEVRRLHASTVATVGPVGGLALPGVRVAVSGTVHAPATTNPPKAHTVEVVATADPGNTAAIATARAAGAHVTQLPAGETDLQAAPDAITALHQMATSPTILLGSGFQGTANPGWSVAAARTGFQWAAGGQTFFPANRFIALYGAPGTPSLGVLGEQGVTATITRAQQVAAAYVPFSDRKVTPMLELIATVAAGSPGPGNTYSNELPVAQLEPYVDAAAAAHMPVVLDLQPGRTDFLTQAKQYEPLLVKPNVSLALDPEWRLTSTQVPLKQIGSVSANEVNSVSAWLAGLIDQHGLPPKMFVLHQFRLDMLQNRNMIDTSHPELSTVIHVDGQGSQPDKQATWNALHVNAPTNVAWGWKNFYDEDTPMLTPEQTMTGVHPTPDLVTYQ